MANKNTKVYLVGSGIASLAAAVFLIEDAGVPGGNITIFENTKLMGGSLDADDLDKDKAYVMRGHRILAKKTFECSFALLDRIPSLSDPGKSIKTEIMEFNQRVKTKAKARLIEKGKVIDARSLGLSHLDRLKLLRVLMSPESKIQSKRINEFFGPRFFDSNFWLEFRTVFAFQPWHSLVEFRRYLLRSFHALPYYDTLECIISAPLCQHDSFVIPILKWLKEQGVRFRDEYFIENIEIRAGEKDRRVEKIFYKHKNEDAIIELGPEDRLIITLGSITADARFGTNESPPDTSGHKQSPSWAFWERLSTMDPAFGNSSTFDDHINRSRFESFTITFSSPLFFELMENLTGNKAGEGGGSTFKDSNWLMSITLPHQPHFLGQPEGKYVAWGYALSPDHTGDYVNKRMFDCSGREIMTELCHHLGFEDHLDEIQSSAVCIPCLMPYITSQFSLRGIYDRPPVRIPDINNLGLIGQYVEIPDDVTFTIEYSIRSAQMAVYSLFGINKEIPPVYKGHKEAGNIFRAIKTAYR